MKNHILKRIIAIITAVIIFVGTGVNAQQSVSDVQSTESTALATQGFENVLSNNDYILSFNSATADVAITDKKTGQTVYSTPVDAANDNLALGANLNNLKSQVLVYYYNDQSLISMNSHSDCLQQQGIEYSVDKEKLSVTYYMGDTSFSVDILPRVLSKKRMEEKIFSKLSEEEIETVLSRYRLYSRDELDAEALKSIRINFPGIDKDDLYIRGKIPEYIAENIWELFEKAGYTVEDLQRDCDENGIENSYQEKPNFKFTIEYKLTNDGFYVQMDPEKMEYLENYKYNLCERYKLNEK